MKTLHNTRNCKYRKFLHTKLKHGKISGKFYKFLCRNFPYRLTARSVSTLVGEVLNGHIAEEKAIAILQTDNAELRRQKELMQSNIECRKKIGCGRGLLNRRGNIDKKDPLYEFNRKK